MNKIVINKNSKLYVVATPIGNLADISFRAIEILKQVTLIAAEDTRHSRWLLDYYGIKTPIMALHEHNEKALLPRLSRHFSNGKSLALISDAGTPLINDPGFRLVRMAIEKGVPVIPIPGACAMITALSVSGLACDRFSFEGFPPRTRAARRTYFKTLLNSPRTLVFYESSHRISECLNDLNAVFPPERQIVIARELTKVHETIIKATLENAERLIQEDPKLRKGEFVVLVQGATEPKKTQQSLTIEQQEILHILLEDCSLKTAVNIAVKITGLPKNVVYQFALDLVKKNST